MKYSMSEKFFHIPHRLKIGFFFPFQFISLESYFEVLQKELQIRDKIMKRFNVDYHR